MKQLSRPPQISGLCDQLIELPRLIDEAPIGILVVDPDQRVILMSRAAPETLEQAAFAGA
ncbi:MAG: hypothetical protein FJ118_01890 [Deltaproteobacteria bacterium]|nr:hypothetical protein [Deltaproteobacteria bacterium]